MNTIRFPSLQSNQQPNYVFRCDQAQPERSSDSSQRPQLVTRPTALAASGFVFHYKRLRETCEGEVLGGEKNEHLSCRGINEKTCEQQDG